MKLMMSVTMLAAMLSCLAFPSRFAAAETFTQSLYATADAFVWSPSDSVIAAGTYADAASRNFGALNSRHVAAATAHAPGKNPQGTFEALIAFDAEALASALNTLYGSGGWTLDAVALQLMTSDNIATTGIFNAPGSSGKFSVSYMEDDGDWTQGSGYLSPPNYGTDNDATWNSIHSVLDSHPATPLSVFDFVAQGNTKLATYADLGSENLTGQTALFNALVAGDEISLLLAAADDRVAFNFTSLHHPKASTTPTYIPTLILTISTVPEPSMALLGAGAAALLASRRQKE